MIPQCLHLGVCLARPRSHPQHSTLSFAKKHSTMASVDESDQTQTSPVLSPFECTCQHASTTHAESCVVDQFCHQLIGTLVGGAADTLGNPELPNAGIAPLRPYLGASTRNSGAAAASYQRFYTAWRHQTRDEELDGELLKATKGRPELRTLVRRLIERTATWEGVGPEDANVLKAEWEKGADPGLLAKCLGSPHLGAPEKVKMASEVARNSWPPLEIADGWDRLSPEQIRATFDHLGPGETMVEKSVSVCGTCKVPNQSTTSDMSLQAESTSSGQLGVCCSSWTSCATRKSSKPCSPGIRSRKTKK